MLKLKHCDTIKSFVCKKNSFAYMHLDKNIFQVKEK